jgi:uncharacterized protein HemY
MDAYNLHQKIFQLWQQLAHQTDATAIKKKWADVPVYIKQDGRLVQVNSVQLEDNKIVLSIDNGSSN